MFKPLTDEEICEVCSDNLFLEFKETCTRDKRRCLTLRDDRYIAQAQMAKDAGVLLGKPATTVIIPTVGPDLVYCLQFTSSEYAELKKLAEEETMKEPSAEERDWEFRFSELSEQEKKNLFISQGPQMTISQPRYVCPKHGDTNYATMHLIINKEPPIVYCMRCIRDILDSKIPRLEAVPEERPTQADE